MIGGAAMLAVLTAVTPRAMIETASAAIGVDAIHELLEERAEGWSNLELREIAEAIESSAAEAGIDPRLILGLMHTESGFKRGAVSGVGARGLLQLMPSTAAAFAPKAGVAWKGPQTLHQPVANVKIGVAYFGWLLRRFGGDVDLALSAYCHGPYRVLKTLKESRRLDVATQRYSKKVQAAWRRFRARTEAAVMNGPRSIWRPYGPYRAPEPELAPAPSLRLALTSMQTYTPES